MAEQQRASIAAIKEETTVGTPVLPSAGSDYIPLRSGGFSIEPGIEEIESDELVNSIGAAKSSLGKETPSGSHNVYLKHSETEGTAPEYALLLKSAMGSLTNKSEFDTIAGSTAGTSSARGVVKVDSGEGTNYSVGQALLIKDDTNGYNIRNVYEINTDDLGVNFNLATAPGTGVNLGQPTYISPSSSDHPSYTMTMRNGNGAALQVVAGCRTSAITMNMNAGEQAECEFSYEGTSYYYNPIEITSSNNKFDFKDTSAGSEKTATLDNKLYKSPVDLAAEMTTKFSAASSNTITVTYSSTDGKFTIATSGAELELLWNTGTNTANSVGATIGFAVAADDTGATSYEGDNAIDLSESSLTVSYDDSDNIVVKNNELMIGDFDDNFCREASNVSFTIDTPTEEVGMLNK